MVTFKTIPNRIGGNLIGFSVYVKTETGRPSHVGTFSMSSAMSAEERRIIGIQFSQLMEKTPPEGGQ